MNSLRSIPADTGLEVLELHDDVSFSTRILHPHDLAAQVEGMKRIARAFVESPETILQELANASVELCGADSAGISLEKDNGTDEDFYHWVATAGKYSQFLDARLPRYPSACGLCLERGKPQRFRVGQPFFDLLGVNAPLVTDGLLLPWEVAGTRGTIFVMAHGRTEAFDGEDCRIMEILADFAAMGIRQRRQQEQLVEHAGIVAQASLANDLAHRINNPLQSVSNLVFLAQQGKSNWDVKTFGRKLSRPVQRLSALVQQLLILPITALREK